MENTRIKMREVLAFFKDYDFVLLGGEAGLDNAVESVSVLELDASKQNPAWYLGNELVLSTLHAFSTVEGVIEAVHLLSSRNVAALGVHQGTKPSALDPRIIDAANRDGFPLFSIPHYVPYSIIFTRVYESIFNKQAAIILKSEEINNALTKALFAKDSVEAIAQTIVGLTQKTVLIFDEEHRILTGNAVDAAGDALLASLRDRPLNDVFSGLYTRPHKNDAANCAQTISLKLPSHDNPAILMPSFSGEEYVGGIMLLLTEPQSRQQGSQVDLLCLSHSVTTLAIVQMKKRAVREAEEKMRGDFYSGLLDGTIESEESMAVRASKLGVPLHGVHCAAEMKIICGEALSRNALPVAGVERLLETARHCLRQLHDKNALLAERDGCLMVLHFRRNIAGDVIDAHLREIYECVREKASTMPESPEILIGVGLPCESLMQLAQSHRQAGRALALGRKAAREQGLFFFGRMGVYSLLDAKSTDEFNENCASELNRLRSIFGENAEMYFNTLEVYFDSGDLLGASAKRMDIHVNTVKYRLNKIKDALGKAVFTDGTEKMRLYLLIKMRKIL